jgi:hypothetical protein
VTSWGCFAGPCLRSLRRLWIGSFRAVREGMGVFASKARFDPIPLPFFGVCGSVGRSGNSIGKPADLSPTLGNEIDDGVWARGIRGG